jgi:hypothetical protein
MYFFFYRLTPRELGCVGEGLGKSAVDLLMLEENTLDSKMFVSWNIILTIIC